MKISRILERFKSGDSSDSLLFNLVLYLEHFVLAGDRLHKSQPVFRYCKSLSVLSSLCLDGRALNGIFPRLESPKLNYYFCTFLLHLILIRHHLKINSTLQGDPQKSTTPKLSKYKISSKLAQNFSKCQKL